VIDTTRREPRQAFAVPVHISKLTRPALRDGIVDRAVLISRLCDTRDSPVVAIVAPAGYGKTTALAQWAEKDDRPFAWISIDPTFDDPAVLITHLAAAIDEVQPIDADVLEPLVAPRRLSRERVLAGLERSLATATEPMVLVVDDVHLLEDIEGIETLMAISDSLGPGAQLAISARWEPSLPLARLRAEGRVADFGPDDLRLDHDGLRDVMTAIGIEVSRDELADLKAKTEGWPVAAYLFARSRRDARGHMAGFRGEDRGLTDYMRSEFIGELPEETVDFLVRTSVLDELSGPLCDSILERDGSAAILDQMESSNLMLLPLDRERHWYRYHQLFREMLRAELDRTDPAAVAPLLRGASAWCRENGQLEGAVRYAQAAGDVDLVGETLVQHGMRLYALGRDSLLKDWFDWLAENGSVDERVAVFGAWLHLLTGAVAEAERWAQVAEAGSPHRPLPDGSPVEAWVLALRAGMATETKAIRNGADRALSLLPPSSQLRPTATFLIGGADFLDGDMKGAEARFAEAAELGESLGGAAAQAVSLASLGMIAIDRGRWERAGELAERATAVVRRAFLEGYPSSALTDAVAARVAAHQGEIASARRYADAAEELMPSVSPSIVYGSLVTRLVLARVQLELGEVRAAKGTLAKVDELLERGPSFEPVERASLELHDLLDEARTRAPGGAKLTPAELRLIPSLATQLSFREIAEQQFVSVHTVKAQVTSIYRKLGVASRTQAVEVAREIGILDS
jgi:LuxR family maltose regulon positive regulatory protein